VVCPVRRKIQDEAVEACQRGDSHDDEGPGIDEREEYRCVPEAMVVVEEGLVDVVADYLVQ
jgi:hypothetical protein